MPDREKIIKGLNYCTHTDGAECPNCPYWKDCGATGASNELLHDALAMLKEQQATINELYTLYDGLCKEIREKYEGDDVCGLCQYDVAYVGESGDWMNECPGFETNECFCMKNSIRKMCGQPLIEDP